MMQIFMSKQSRKDRLRKGFSLLELLVSVALLGLVLSLLYGAFFQISNSSLKVKKTLENRQELRLLMKIVLDDLQAVRYLKNYAAVSSPGSQRETGLIVQTEMGPRDSESGDAAEISRVDFHASIPTRFFPGAKTHDPELHEVGYSLIENVDTKEWEFIRREDFYLDEQMSDGGKSHVLSKSITGFQVELLESETQLATGGTQENWASEWNSDEKECNKTEQEPFCLPSAIKLTMSLKGENNQEVSDTQVINLCIPLKFCDKKIYPVP